MWIYRPGQPGEPPAHQKTESKCGTSKEYGLPRHIRTQPLLIHFKKKTEIFRTLMTRTRLLRLITFTDTVSAFRLSQDNYFWQDGRHLFFSALSSSHYLLTFTATFRFCHSSTSWHTFQPHRATSFISSFSLSLSPSLGKLKSLILKTHTLASSPLHYCYSKTHLCDYMAFRLIFHLSLH